MFRWFQRRQHELLAEADKFMELYGNAAYRAAVSQALEAHKRGETKREKLLAQVALEIAKRADFEIGLDPAMRYTDKQ